MTVETVEEIKSKILARMAQQSSEQTQDQETKKFNLSLIDDLQDHLKEEPVKQDTIKPQTPLSENQISLNEVDRITKILEEQRRLEKEETFDFDLRVDLMKLDSEMEFEKIAPQLELHQPPVFKSNLILVEKGESILPKISTLFAHACYAATTVGGTATLILSENPSLLEFKP